MVVGMSLYSQIREAYVSGKSIMSIAKRLGISRQTVKKYCEGTTMPGVRKDYLRAPSMITPEIEKFIRTCLENDKEEGLKKQTHTAKRIYIGAERFQFFSLNSISLYFLNLYFPYEKCIFSIYYEYESSFLLRNYCLSRKARFQCPLFHSQYPLSHFPYPLFFIQKSTYM